MCRYIISTIYTYILIIIKFNQGGLPGLITNILLYKLCINNC